MPYLSATISAFDGVASLWIVLLPNTSPSIVKYNVIKLECELKLLLARLHGVKGIAGKQRIFLGLW